MMASEAIDLYGGTAAAARALGVNRSTVKRRLRSEKGLEARPSRAKGHRLEFPAIPARREPVAKQLPKLVEAYKREKAHFDASELQKVKVKDDRPIGLVIFGDVHLDDDGCAWPHLLEDIDICKRTDGCYGVSIGDHSNNWIGKLARLYGEQSASISDAHQRMRWFFLEAGIRWAGIVTGNHDDWGDGVSIIKLMCSGSRDTIPVHVWSSNVELRFPNGATCVGVLGHHFKGSSNRSTTNGPLNEAILNQASRADFIAAGHIHFGGTQSVELPGGRVVHLVRTRGYKDFDGHAKRHTFHEGQRFRSAMVVIDPAAPEHDRCMVFGSLKQGAEVLKALRSRRKTKGKRK